MLQTGLSGKQVTELLIILVPTEASPKFFLDHALEVWYESLPQATKDTYDELVSAMKKRFNGSDGLEVDRAPLSLNMDNGESCASYKNLKKN